MHINKIKKLEDIDLDKINKKGNKNKNEKKQKTKQEKKTKKKENDNKLISSKSSEKEKINRINKLKNNYLFESHTQILNKYINY